MLSNLTLTHPNKLKGYMKKLLMIMLITMISANASAGVTCRVNVALLKSGSPALQSAKVTILNQQTGVVVASTTNHSFSTQLDCGIQYRAEAELNGEKQSRQFDTRLIGGLNGNESSLIFNF